MATRTKPVSVGGEGRYKVFYAMAVPVQVGSVLPFEPNHGVTCAGSVGCEALSFTWVRPGSPTTTRRDGSYYPVQV